MAANSTVTKRKTTRTKPAVKKTRTITALQHIVKKPFIYDGKQMSLGDVFEPAGGKYDEKLIESHCYSEKIKVEVPEE